MKNLDDLGFGNDSLDLIPNNSLKKLIGQLY
jgi:hypothetical protein